MAYSCPVCYQSFPKDLINQHVNDCLNSENKPNDQMEGQSESAQDVTHEKSPIKRKIDCITSAWGCLQPQQSKKLKPDNNKSPLKCKMSPIDSSNKKSGQITANTLMLKKESPLKISRKNNEKFSSFSLPKIADKQASDFNSEEVFNFKIPLAESMRPKNMFEFIGQKQCLGEHSFLRRVFLTESLPSSIIFWGPPGCGKVS